jgi:hypothetical protein
VDEVSNGDPILGRVYRRARDTFLTVQYNGRQGVESTPHRTYKNTTLRPL